MDREWAPFPDTTDGAISMLIRLLKVGMGRLWTQAFLACLIIVPTAGLLHGQATNGSILRTVTDTAGAVVAKANPACSSMNSRPFKILNDLDE